MMSLPPLQCNQFIIVKIKLFWKFLDNQIDDNFLSPASEEPEHPIDIIE